LKISELQGAIKTLIEASSDFTGVPVLIDAGTWPQVPGKEEALRDRGMAISILIPQCYDQTEVDVNGKFLSWEGCAVLIEENVSVNQATPGRITAEDAAHALRDVLSGQLVDSSPGTGLMVGNPYYQNVGTVSGVRVVAMIFYKQFS
jgi:hypothetical protein